MDLAKFREGEKKRNASEIQRIQVDDGDREDSATSSRMEECVASLQRARAIFP